MLPDYARRYEFQKSNALGATWQEILADHPEISVEQVEGVWVATVAVECPSFVHEFGYYLRRLSIDGWQCVLLYRTTGGDLRAEFSTAEQPSDADIERLIDALKRAGVYAGR